MRVTLFGTRGSLAAPGAETNQYGGNTSTVEVCANDGTLLVLDAGTGIRRLAKQIPLATTRIDILLTHLHMDHIQGLGFFGPLYDPGVDVHIWGPASSMLRLEARLSRYLSPPLFPVHLRDLPKVVCHEVPRPPFDIGPFRIRTALVCHPGPTVGYRIEAARGSLVYLPDHEPALGLPNGRWPAPDWISGYDLAFNADLLIHDAQYTDEEYASCVGWGHSTYRHAFEFAAQVGAKRLVPFDHDPPHDDDMLDRLLEDSIRRFKSPCLAAAAAKAMTAKGPPALWSATKFSRICTRVALRGSWLNFNAAVLAGLSRQAIDLTVNPVLTCHGLQGHITLTSPMARSAYTAEAPSRVRAVGQPQRGSSRPPHNN